MLVYDEPTLGLDPVALRQFKDMLRDFTRNGETVFLSSHLLHIVEEIAGSVTVIHEGKLAKKNIPVKEIRTAMPSLEEFLLSAVEEGN